MDEIRVTYKVLKAKNKRYTVIITAEHFDDLDDAKEFVDVLSQDSVTDAYTRVH
tara:strand:+ start:360 stop:521 length:162 start_codon:yes stop_codon:yes gene_type:complete